MKATTLARLKTLPLGEFDTHDLQEAWNLNYMTYSSLMLIKLANANIVIRVRSQKHKSVGRPKNIYVRNDEVINALTRHLKN